MLRNSDENATLRRQTLENVMYLAASAEYGSEHPLAKGSCSGLEMGLNIFVYSLG